MFDVNVKLDTLPNHTKRFYDRASAETWAIMSYDCDNVYAVEVTNSETGELIFYRSKG